MSIVLNFSGHWRCLGEINLIGCIHDFEQHQDALTSINNIDVWATKLKELKGFFSIFKQVDNAVFAAVDHIRSRPLFYAINDQDFYLSDSAEWVRQQLNDNEMDELAKAEFQLAGYVTGKDTLYKSVKQLQAGECLVYTDGKLLVKRYYRFEHREPVTYSQVDWLAKLDLVAKASIQRLIHYANGRQIVVPLSGGYDSRLIATLLKEAGYKNILTFSYGAKGTKEAVYSRAVAENLGLKWHFIEYTKELWQVAWQTRERKYYQLQGSNWTSLAHMQDWLAVKVIKEKGIVESDAVFAPGHCCVTGLIPPEITSKLSWTAKDTIENILSKHFNLCPFSELINKEYDELAVKSKIESYLAGASTLNEHASKIMEFNWEERQSKYIGNSVRVYEFFGYDWWMPLWDQELTTLWEELPLAKRINRELYIGYVTDIYLKMSVDKKRLGNAANGGLVSLVANSKVLNKLRLKDTLKRVYRFFIKRHLQTGDCLLINSPQDFSEVKKLEDKSFLMNGVTAYFFLKEFSPKL
ncbi:asparagine synthetase B family protein [Thiopseudomonas alkaliphila]|uniref:asparagine synthase-related protein n=1 Tax=Thiopseudomonas alkaliphila TaxID=1697053 RepID=UPI00069E8760|nr:asparagine synthetase B family protein [Thiopseudomonas alkaliphila]